MEDSVDEGKIPNGCHRKYLKILFDVFLWLAVGIPVLYLYVEGKPSRRGFLCDDPGLSYPYRPDTVSTTALTVLGFTVLIAVIVLTEMLNLIDKKCRQPCPSTYSVLNGVKMYPIYLVGFVSQQFFVQVVKNYLGRPRPNFFDVCQPVFNRSLCPGYISSYKCTSSHSAEEVLDSWRSFPSGHASLSMYMAVFSCFYLQKYLYITFSHILKYMLQYGFIFTSLLCGVSRVVDNKHHPSDVIVGFVVGATVAVLVFQLLTKKVVREESSTNTDSLLVTTIKHSLNCCDFKQQIDLEPQTPAPLLPHEYSNGFIDVTSQKLVIAREIPEKKSKLEIPLNVRRHFSTPITPSSRADAM